MTRVSGAAYPAPTGQPTLGSLGTPRTEVMCTDCRQPVEAADLVLRMISSSLTPAPFHADCYRLHIPAPREPLGDEL